MQQLLSPYNTLGFMSLIATIAEAFRGERPSENEVFGHQRTQDDEGIFEFFRSRSWQELNASDLKKHEFALSCFTNRGFTYYMPAYLSALVTNPDALDTAGDSFLSRLISSNNSGSKSAFSAYIDSLTNQQLGVVEAVILVELDRQGGHICSAISNNVSAFQALLRAREAQHSSGSESSSA